MAPTPSRRFSLDLYAEGGNKRRIKVKEEIHLMVIPGGHEWLPPADALDEFAQ